MDLTLEQIFGKGANQTELTVTIQKSSLVGFVPTANNRAEEILAAIIQTAHDQFEGSLTDPLNNPVLSPDNMTVDYDNSYLYLLLGINKWQIQFIEQKIRYNFLVFSYSLYAN